MSIIEDRLPLLETVKLDSGGHSPDGQFCVMELVAYMAGEPWSASPKCASKVITSFLVSWNDSLNDDDRQMLVPLVPLVIGTATGQRHEETRAWMCTDWLARECAPAFLRCAGLTEQAVLLESLAPLTSAAKARKAQPVLHQARSEAAASLDDSRAASRDASLDASRDASWAASWAASRAASWAASRDASLAASWAAKGGYKEKYAAAYAVLEPAVKILQPSAVRLVERMCEVGRS